MNVSGSITINGLTDRELGKIWEIKSRNEKDFNFQPNAMQPVGTNPPSYNNVIFHYASVEGLKIVNEVLEYVLRKDEQATAVGQ